MAIDYQRDKDGMRLDFRGINTVLPPDQMPDGKFPYAQNVRRYKERAITGRALQGAALFALAGASVNTMRRLNDSTPAGPFTGFIIVSSAGSDLFANGVQINASLSGQRTAMVPFRPNASVQPWMYVADENVMLKVRSDGTTFKQGIKEPQAPVGAVLSTFPQNGLINPFEVLAQWTAINGALTLGVRSPAQAITKVLFDFDTNGQASVVWPGTTTPNSSLFRNANLGDAVFVGELVGAPGNTTIGSIVYDSGTTGLAWITLASPLTVTVNQVYLLSGPAEYVRILAIQSNSGQTLIRVTTVGTHNPGDTLTGTASYRMNFTQGAADGDTLSDDFVTLEVSGAGNSVQFSGNVVANFYTHQHPFNGQCELRNVIDGGNNPGGGGYPLLATGNGNSVLFDPPALGPYPPISILKWATLDGTGAIVGSTQPYAGATEQYTMVCSGTLVFPAAGNYVLTVVHDDGMYFGMDSGVTLVSAGQPTFNPAPAATVSALHAYPLIGANNQSGNSVDTYTINVPVAGPVNFEFDWCNWEHAQTLQLYVNGSTPVPGTGTPVYGMYTFTPALSSLLNNRQVQPTDLIHLLLRTNLPGSITNITVTFNIDPVAQDFVTNALVWTIPSSQLPAANTWGDVSIPVQALTRIGTGQVSAINVTAGGTGYVSGATPISFSGGGGGSGAAATSIVTPGGVLTGIIVTNPGSGYTVPPTVIIGGAGSAATAVAIISGVNANLTLATGIFGVQIVITKAAGTVDIDFANLILVGQFGPTVLVGQVADSWFYRYRSTFTGAISNPSPPMREGLSPSAEGVVLTGTPSPDPQVDMMDFFREGGSIAEPVYLGSGPNTPAPFLDDFDDITVENNAQLEFDNFEPFPSIDLPRAGTLSTNGFAVTLNSGDNFNVRWLPGTVILISGIAYALYNRPTSTTVMNLLQNAGVQSNVPYQIQQPILAAQPMGAMWGPTDNVAFNFACRDPLRPGTLYFTKGNNPDSAPDTNQIEVTSPSEPLQNGCLVSGYSLVLSTERGFLAYPNFFNALATVTGTQGSAFTMVATITERGLFAKDGLCTDGGANAFFIAKDGILLSPGGQGAKSITDAELYNLFPHENTTPQNVTLAGKTIFAPDFTKPDAMALSFADGYVYFDYLDQESQPRTLVYDVKAGGWVVDVYQFAATSHVQEEGETEGVLTGCSDGSIRRLSSTGTEVSSAVVLLPAFNAGDTRAEKRYGDIFVEASVPVGQTVNVAPYTNKYNTAVAGASPSALVSVGAIRAPYIVDFNNGDGLYAVDFEAVLSWNLNGLTILYTWQPTLVPQPEGIQNRPQDWDDGGEPGNKFVQGLILEADTFGNPKAFQVQRGDDLSLFTPNEVPVVFNGQSIKPFTFTPPFLAHNMRIIATDGVKWRYGQGWKLQYIFEPFPEATIEWQNEMSSLGVIGWLHIREMNIPAIATADMLLTLVFDHWPTIVVTVPNTGGLFVKQKVELPANKTKLVSFRVSSTQPFYLFEKDVEVKFKQWGTDGPFQIVKPFGGPSNARALV